VVCVFCGVRWCVFCSFFFFLLSRRRIRLADQDHFAVDLPPTSVWSLPASDIEASFSITLLAASTIWSRCIGIPARGRPPTADTNCARVRIGDQVSAQIALNVVVVTGDMSTRTPAITVYQFTETDRGEFRRRLRIDHLFGRLR